MTRKSNATTVSELIYELEALNDIINYIEICEKNARAKCTHYMKQHAETGEEYWGEEALEQDTKAEAFAEYKRLLVSYAIG